MNIYENRLEVSVPNINETDKPIDENLQELSKAVGDVMSSITI